LRLSRKPVQCWQKLVKLMMMRRKKKKKKKKKKKRQGSANKAKVP